jgi:D-galactose 1-dehydrogenase
MKPIRVAVVGMGKIARDQHLPAITGNECFCLAATVDPAEPGIEGIPHASSLTKLLAERPALDAVVLCTPARVRYELAAQALARNLSVMLEKPPGATVCEVETLHEKARTCGVTLLASWHSRFAPGVESARNWLATPQITRVSVIWHEDVRDWHPGQQWIWEPGGLGVFDPGINALSILTRILPRPFFVTRAQLAFPANRAAPIAAAITFRDTAGLEIAMDLDWRQVGSATWDIIAETDAGTLKLQSGGSVLSLPSGTQRFKEREYPNLYAHFDRLIQAGGSDVDCRPLQLVADAFLYGQHEFVDAFHAEESTP